LAFAFVAEGMSLNIICKQ